MPAGDEAAAMKGGFHDEYTSYFSRRYTDFEKVTSVRIKQVYCGQSRYGHKDNLLRMRP